MENGQQLLRYWSSFPFLTSTNRSRSWSVGFVSIIVDILSFTTPERRGKGKKEDWERKREKKKEKKRNVSTRTDTSTPEFSSRFTTKELVYYFDYFLFRCSFNVSSYGIEKVSLRWHNFKMELFKMLLRCVHQNRKFINIKKYFEWDLAIETNGWKYSI